MLFELLQHISTNAARTIQSVKEFNRNGLLDSSLGEDPVEDDDDD